MFIEFSCPVCQSPLSLKNNTPGGHVNCPKCQKLILLPAKSPLPRHNPDIPPTQGDHSYSAEEVTEAICISVEPYRTEIDTKADLLDDAVEMIKVRNERIKELETLSLNIQSELWALEAEMDEVKEESNESPTKNSSTVTHAILKDLIVLETSFHEQKVALEAGTLGLHDAREWIKKLMSGLEECSSRLGKQS